MRWHRREEPGGAADEEEEVTMSEETLRAKDAARQAGVELAQVRSQAPKIARTSEELDDLNSNNGFYLLIRQALGS
jgi:hypothetical protein